MAEVSAAVNDMVRSVPVSLRSRVSLGAAASNCPLLLLSSNNTHPSFQSALERQASPAEFALHNVTVLPRRIASLRARLM